MVEATQHTSNSEAKTYIDLSSCHVASETFSEHCGYCKGRDKPGRRGHASWGFKSSKMTISDYDMLMNRGWRRGGTYFYKWDQSTSCCQGYPIGVNCDEFQISKSQKQVLKTFNKYLKGKITPSEDGKNYCTNKEQPSIAAVQPTTSKKSLRASLSET